MRNRAFVVFGEPNDLLWPDGAGLRGVWHAVERQQEPHQGRQSADRRQAPTEEILLD